MSECVVARSDRDEAISIGLWAHLSTGIASSLRFSR
jgi:hypothetical protein